MTTKTYFLGKDSSAKVTAYLGTILKGGVNKGRRGGIIIFPGGGYTHCSPREGEPIALKYLAEGFNVFVVNYTCKQKFPAALKDAAYAIYKIRQRADEFGIHPGKIAVLGFSAGGHLAGSLSTMWKDKELTGIIGCQPHDIRPSASVLCYPVISGSIYPHKPSFDILLGKEAGEAEILSQSLENRVTPETPPTFIWCTANDRTVNAVNSLIFAEACVINRVPCQFHMFDDGPHGMADCTSLTADRRGFNPECSIWFQMSLRFLRKYLGIL